MKYQSGYNHQLAQVEVIQLAHVRPAADIDIGWIKLSTDGLLTLAKGYAWNGITGIPNWIERTRLVRCLMRGSAGHDALYQLMRKGLLPLSQRKQADADMRDIFIEDGAWAWAANLAYKFVRSFLGRKAAEDKPNPIITAP
jgi:hypothetical protein